VHPQHEDQAREKSLRKKETSKTEGNGTGPVRGLKAQKGDASSKFQCGRTEKEDGTEARQRRPLTHRGEERGL